MESLSPANHFIDFRFRYCIFSSTRENLPVLVHVFAPLTLERASCSFLTQPDQILWINQCHSGSINNQSISHLRLFPTEEKKKRLVRERSAKDDVVKPRPPHRRPLRGDVVVVVVGGGRRGWCSPTCSLSACLLSSSRRSCSISSYLRLCSRSCCFLISRSRRCCCRWRRFRTCACVCVCA